MSKTTTCRSGWFARLRAMPVRTLIFVIELYRHMISPLRLPTCRFMPTCSQYAVDALDEYGLLRGSWLTVVRLAKCGPWHPGGWDPIPDRGEGHYGRHGCGDSRSSTTQHRESESFV